MSSDESAQVATAPDPAQYSLTTILGRVFFYRLCYADPNQTMAIVTSVSNRLGEKHLSGHQKKTALEEARWLATQTHLKPDLAHLVDASELKRLKPRGVTALMERLEKDGVPPGIARILRVQADRLAGATTSRRVKTGFTTQERGQRTPAAAPLAA